MADKAPMLGREEFNRIAGSMFPNTYGEDSRAVLNQELQKALAAGDAGAERSARQGLARVGTNTGSPAPIQGRTMAATDDTGSPIPEARMGLDSLVGDVANVIGAITAGNVLRSTAAEAQASATMAAGQATAEATRLQAESINNQDAQVMNFLRTIGLDITDPGSALRSELASQAVTRTNRMKVDDQIVQLEQINFFQNPLDFLMAQPKLQQLTAQYNQLARRENESDAEVARMQSITDTVVRNQPSRNADLVRQTAQATALAQVKVAEAQAQQVTANNAAGNAKALLDQFALKENVFAKSLQIIGLEEGIRERKQGREDRNFYRDEALRLAEEKAEERRAKTQEQTALVTGLNLYRQAINGSVAPQLTPEDVKRMSPQQRAAWYEVVLRGNYGGKYSQSIPFISTYGNDVGASMSGNSSFMTNVRNIESRVNAKIPDILNRENTRGALSGTKISHQDAIRMAYDELFAEDVLLGLPGSNKSGVKPGNPYAINFDNALAESVANPNSLGPMVNKILLESKARVGGASLDQTFTPTMLLNGMEARVRAGEVPPKQAAEQIASFMALQSGKSYMSNGLKYLNLGPATDWNVKLDATGEKNINLMDATTLERYLTAQLAREKSLQRPGLTNPFVPFR